MAAMANLFQQLAMAATVDEFLRLWLMMTPKCGKYLKIHNLHEQFLMFHTGLTLGKTASQGVEVRNGEGAGDRTRAALARVLRGAGARAGGAVAGAGAAVAAGATATASAGAGDGDSTGDGGGGGYGRVGGGRGIAVARRLSRDTEIVRGHCVSRRPPDAEHKQAA